MGIMGIMVVTSVSNVRVRDRFVAQRGTWTGGPVADPHEFTTQLTVHAPIGGLPTAFG